MKVGFKKIPDRKTNDCWAHALSYLLDTPYAEVRKTFKKMQVEDNSVYYSIIQGYLIRYEYETIKRNCSLNTAIQTYDSSRGLLLFGLWNDEGHVVYVKDGIIHEDIAREQVESYFKEFDITHITTMIKSIPYKDMEFIGFNEEEVKK